MRFVAAATLEAVRQIEDANGFLIVSALDVRLQDYRLDAEPLTKDLARRVDRRLHDEQLRRLRAIARETRITAVGRGMVLAVPAALCAVAPPPQEPVGEAIVVCDDIDAELATFAFLRAAVELHPSMPKGNDVASVLLRHGLVRRYLALPSLGAPTDVAAILALHFLEAPIFAAQNAGLDPFDVERLGDVVSEGIDVAAFDRKECDVAIAKDVQDRVAKRLQRALGVGPPVQGLRVLVDGTVVTYNIGSIRYTRRIVVSHKRNATLVRVSERNGYNSPEQNKVALLSPAALLELDAALAALDLSATKDAFVNSLEDATTFSFIVDGPALRVRFACDSATIEHNPVFQAVQAAMLAAEKRALSP